MACASNFSPHILINAKRCFISQKPILRNFNALLRGKECASVEDPSFKRYLSIKNSKRFQSRKEVDRTGKMNEISCDPDEFEKKLNEMYPLSSLGAKNARRWMIMLSIHKRILELEAIITADGLLPISETPSMVVKKLYECTLNFWYVEQKWLRILQKTNSPRLERLIALIQADDMDEEIFSAAMGKLFFLIPSACPDHSVNYEIPSLTEFKPKDIEIALELIDFGRLTDLNFRRTCVLHILKKDFSREFPRYV